MRGEKICCIEPHTILAWIDVNSMENNNSLATITSFSCFAEKKRLLLYAGYYVCVWVHCVYGFVFAISFHTRHHTTHKYRFFLFLALSSSRPATLLVVNFQRYFVFHIFFFAVLLFSAFSIFIFVGLSIIWIAYPLFNNGNIFRWGQTAYVRIVRILFSLCVCCSLNAQPYIDSAQYFWHFKN